MKKYFIEMIIGLFLCVVIISATLASAIDIPFIYQGF